MPEDVKLSNVDIDLLCEQSDRLSELASFIMHGETSKNAEEWPDAIEGIQNLLANIIATSRQRGF